MKNELLMTVVVPAYNEAHRLPKTLPRIWEFIISRDEALDMIVVNNNSEDETGAVARAFAAEHPGVQVFDQPIRGKGAAVRKGMLAAQGRYVFMCDADLAMPIEELPRFFPQQLGGEYDIAIASREAPGARRYGEPWYRHLMGRVFNFIVRTLAVPRIQDTQCGFKALRRDVAHALLPLLTIDGWAFDVELLALALRRGYHVIEVGIPWYYGEGSRVSPLRDSLHMFREVLRVRRNLKRGVYEGKVEEIGFL
ncbi:MAG: dolichyl-phosphate beta-glucosyltransferase [Anaerolineae bacterium]